MIMEALVIRPDFAIEDIHKSENRTMNGQKV